MTNAVVGIDLADRNQMVVVCDQASKVVARRSFRCKPGDLGASFSVATAPLFPLASPLMREVDFDRWWGQMEGAQRREAGALQQGDRVPGWMIYSFARTQGWTVSSSSPEGPRA